MLASSSGSAASQSSVVVAIWIQGDAGFSSMWVLIWRLGLSGGESTVTVYTHDWIQ